MMRRQGFTIIELLVTLVLTGLVMGAAYQVLFVQQRSTRAQTLQSTERSSLRVASAVLETELREAASFSGSADAESDIGMIAPDSIRFRALRQFAVVCDLNKGTKWLDLWVLGEKFAKSDSLMAYAEDDTTTTTDDRWQLDQVTNIGSVVTASCATSWPGTTPQGISTPGMDMAGMQKGGPVRGFEWISYGLLQSNGEWVIARWTSGGDRAIIADGLDAASTSTPLFRYYDSSGTATTDPDAVAQIEMTIRTPGNPDVGVAPETLSTRLYLRNN